MDGMTEKATYYGSKVNRTPLKSAILRKKHKGNRLLKTTGNRRATTEVNFFAQFVLRTGKRTQD